MDLVEICGPAEAAWTHARLTEYNSAFITDYDEWAWCVRDAAGAPCAGLVATRDLDCLTIDYLFVEEAQRGRGYGAALLHRAEAAARLRRVKRIVCNTFSFQAPRFYEARGYRLFAKLDPCLGPHGQYFFIKEL